jgi:hypothetical protein
VTLNKNQVCFSFIYFSFLIINVDDENIDKSDREDIDVIPDEQNRPNDNEDEDNEGFIPNKSIIFITCTLIS